MRRYPTIADGVAQGSDNFLLLRFLAAALVIYGHAPSISGQGPADLFLWLGWGDYSGEIAVDLFFVISGFLVSASWLRRAHLGDFLLARALRIVPAYAACILACAFALGPMFTSLPLHDYYADAQTWNYALTNLHFGPHLVWLLPGVFTGHPFAVVNGSIWTLPIEVLMYAGIAVLGVFGILRRRLVGTILLMLLCIFAIARIEPTATTPFTDYLRMAGLFALGSLCWLWRERIPNHGAVVLTFVVLAWATVGTLLYAYLFALAEVAFVFWFAYRLGVGLSLLRRFNSFGDYSYGLYLWGYPAQQIAVALVGPQSALVNAVCGFLIALPLAVVSWHVLERPALRLKNRWV